MQIHSERQSAAPGPGQAAAALDVVIFVAAAFALWGLEEVWRATGRYPLPGLMDGAPGLVGLFFVAVWLMKWRGQTWSAFGLWRPRRWWHVPAWGMAAIVVNVIAQLTVAPVLGRLLDVPPPDLSRYDSIRGNLGLFLIVTPGAMLTGGFIEEFLYRGMMVDRLARILGRGRWSTLYAALLCGVPFGLIHFKWGVGGMFVTAIMGSVLGLMYLATRRNLWPLVFGHALLDLLLMLQMYLAKPPA